MRLLSLSAAAMLSVSAHAGVIGGPNSYAGHYMPEVDESKIIGPTVGFDAARVVPYGGSRGPIPSDMGAFRTACGYSHMSHDDPLVFSGQQGKSHLHTFFGNSGTDYTSTSASILTTGNSTCRGGLLNRSAYWVPALVNQGVPMMPIELTLYYKKGYNPISDASFLPVPQGLAMIAGNANNDQDVWTVNGVKQTWHGSPYNWKCMSTKLGYSLLTTQQIEQCPAGTDQLWMVLEFPQCWDGAHLDSPDHKSHMSYFKGSICPTTHPFPIVQISYEVKYPVLPTDVMSNWRLSSDMYAPSLPGGRSAHGDYMMGWNKDIMQMITTNCIRARWDCHSDFISSTLLLN